MVRTRPSPVLALLRTSESSGTGLCGFHAESTTLPSFRPRRTSDLSRSRRRDPVLTIAGDLGAPVLGADHHVPHCRLHRSTLTAVDHLAWPRRHCSPLTGLWHPAP